MRKKLTTTARRLRHEETKAERRFWNAVRDRRLDGWKFRRQIPRGNFIVDFVCLEAHLVVELDGGQHNTPEHEAKDQARIEWLENNGYRVLRFWNNEVFENLEGVLTVVTNALSEPPHPSPLPPGERGQ